MIFTLAKQRILSMPWGEFFITDDLIDLFWFVLTCSLWYALDLNVREFKIKLWFHGFLRQETLSLSLSSSVRSQGEDILTVGTRTGKLGIIYCEPLVKILIFMLQECDQPCRERKTATTATRSHECFEESPKVVSSSSNSLVIIGHCDNFQFYLRFQIGYWRFVKLPSFCKILWYFQEIKK